MVAPLPTALVDQLTTAAQRILENSNKLHAVYLNNLQADTTTAQTGLLTASLLASPSVLPPSSAAAALEACGVKECYLDPALRKTAVWAAFCMGTF